MNPVMSDRGFTRAEVASLGENGQVCFVVKNIVYDVGTYLEDHPGGARILREYSGSDASAAFEDVGHSDGARETLEKFAIGRIAGDEEIHGATASIFRSRVLPQTTVMTRGRFISFQMSQDSASRLLTFTCVLLATKLLWADQINLNSFSAMMSNFSGFWGGTALSLTGSAVIFSSIVTQFSKTIVMTKGFRIYPPVTKVNKVILGPSRSAGVSHKHDETLGVSQFKSMRLADRACITTNSYRLVLSPTHETEMLRVPSGQHVQLRLKDKDGIIVRSYTPTSTLPDGSLEFAIKVYGQGRMGNALLAAPLDSIIDVRGPLGSFKNYHRFLCDRLGVLAGGSGITPLFALIRDIVNNEKDETKIALLYAEASQDTTMMFHELNDLARRFPEKLTVHYFWRSASSTCQDGRHRNADLSEMRDQRNADSSFTCTNPGRIALASMQRLLPAVSAGSKYLVCGPEGFADQMIRELGEMGASKPVGPGHSTDKVFVF